MGIKMISIIIPVYRSEKTLERCIDSLKQQTYTDLEIIIIVDEPPDASGILADRLAKADERIRVIHQQNKGVSAARNTGIQAAQGEYIQFVDSDDYVDRHLCWRLLAGLEESGAQLALCGFHHMYFGKDVVKLPNRQGSLLLKEAKQELLCLYEGGFLNMPWNKLFRKDKIRQEFRQDMDLGEDLLFNMAYLENCEKIAVVAEALCYYIQDGRGTTLSTRKRENRMKNAFYLYEQMKSFFLRKYGGGGTGGVLESRLMTEFLDEMEGLAFDGGRSLPDKKAVISQYYKGYERLQNKELIRLSLPDYRILYFFFRRRLFLMTLFMVELRGLIVRLVRSVGRERGTCRN